MPKFGLEVAIAKMIDDIIPDDVVRQERAVKGVVSEDATVLPEALANLPWQRADISIPGPAVVGNGVARAAFPQGAVIRHVSIFAKTAPSGTYNATIVSPSGSESFSLQAGSQAGMEKMNLRVPNGGWVTVNVTSAGGAEDITLVLHYSSFGYTSGSASGGGSSGGGGGGGGTGAVESVNGETGHVVLNADDISDNATTHKFVTAGDLVTLENTSGVNTGDQDLSGYALSSSLALVATSGDYDDLDNKPTLGSAAAMSSGAFATAAQGSRADTAVQPGDLGDLATKDVVAIGDIDASGTANNATYLRGDGTWASVSSGGGGNMSTTVYDPNGVADDAFDMDNMVEGSTTKILTAAEREKLNGIAAGATANATNAQLRARSTHTGTQDASTINGLADVATSGAYADLSGIPIHMRGEGLGITGGNTVSSAGNHRFNNASITFTGLDSGRAYWLEWSIDFQAIGSGTIPRGHIGAMIDHAGGQSTIDHNSYMEFATYRHFQHRGDAGLYTPNGSGEITIAPYFRYISGTIQFLQSYIVASVR